MSILSGLDKLGLGDLEQMDLYADPEKEEAERKKKEQGKEAQIPEEKEFLFDKSHTCPVCDRVFKARTLRSGRARLLRTDMDLRPVYEYVEPLKYDVISCPECGYTALSRYFAGLMESQAKRISESISKAYHPADPNKQPEETYTYPEAINRYKLCLANAIVKHAKASEKAYICLKAGWLVRSMEEALEEEGKNSKADRKKLEEQQNEFLKNALEGFTNARQTEGYPMCGMDELTVDYLLAVLAMRFGQKEVTAKLISEILTSTSANNRIKDKAREVKEVLLEQIRASRR